MMSFDRSRPNPLSNTHDAAVQREPGPDEEATFVRQSLGEIGSMVQRRAGGAHETADVQQTAQAGVSGAGTPLPHLDAIQRSFGRHDVSGVSAHVGGDAAEASEALGASAYATGDRVAFAGEPDLHTAAHEAAHTVQQAAGVVESELD